MTNQETAMRHLRHRAAQLNIICHQIQAKNLLTRYTDVNRLLVQRHSIDDMVTVIQSLIPDFEEPRLVQCARDNVDSIIKEQGKLFEMIS